MRRGALLGLVVALVPLVSGCGGSDSSQYKVAAIFDNASFLTPGVDVRIAGAKVGKVTDLTVTRAHKARVEMTIDKRFGPFHADADCTIQPQSLISERFVNCSPGTPAAAAVPKGGDGVDVLGVQGTHSPVDIDQVLNTFNLPVRQRLTLLLDGLGVGLASRGDDLNATIRRAAPALQATKDTLDILDRDRAQLTSLIENSDVVLRQLASGRDRVAAFVRDAGVAAETSGVRRRQLAAAVRDLPALLTQARPSLQQLTTFAQQSTPFARELERGAPGLRQVVDALPAFAKQATPAVARLGTTARRASKALPDIAPQVRRLATFAADGRPAGALNAELFDSFRQKGTIEALGGFFYYAASAVARFDKNSHYLPAYLIGGICLLYAKTPVPGCDGHFPASRASILAAARAAEREKATPKRTAKPARPGATPDAPASSTTPALPTLPKIPGVPQLPPVTQIVPKAVEGVQGLIDALGSGKKQGGETPQQQDAVKGLLGYLLG